MSKEPKDEVEYSTGHLHSHCGPTFHDDSYYCRHFIPGVGKIGTCEVVAGAIEPHMWCTLYLKTRATKR
jgi:hypothetical protein